MGKSTKVFLVLLRIVVGWHFMYEGLWKLNTDDAGQQYLTSRYFLQTATARLRDDLDGSAGSTEPAAAEARIDKWNDDIVAHFKGQNNALNAVQMKDLASICDEMKQRARDRWRLEDNGPIVPIDWANVHEQILKITDKPGDRFTALEYLQGSTGPLRPLFRAMVPDIEGLERLTTRSAQLRLDDRYSELLDHYGSFTNDQKLKLAAARDQLKKSIAATIADPAFQTRIADYKYGLERVREYERDARQPFSKERREAYRSRLDVIGAELLAFVNEPLVELTRQAQAIATTEQLERGPAPPPRTQTWLIDWVVKWGLTLIGFALIAGLFSQWVAAAAAAQLAMFYFAAPPLPGLPAATMGGHFLYIDRNFIEMIAALLLVTVPSGKWAGLDAWLDYFVVARLRAKRAHATEPAVPESPVPQEPASKPASAEA